MSQTYVVQKHDKLYPFTHGQGLVGHEIYPVSAAIAGQARTLFQLYRDFTVKPYGFPLIEIIWHRPPPVFLKIRQECIYYHRPTGTFFYIIELYFYISSDIEP